MAINYNWSFNPLECYPTASGETDVVFKAHWRIHATTGSYNAYSMGVQTIGVLESGSTFISYNELTEDTVYGWVTSSMELSMSGSIDSMYSYLSQSICDQINPPILIQQAPWLTVPI